MFENLLQNIGIEVIILIGAPLLSYIVNKILNYKEGIESPLPPQPSPGGDLDLSTFLNHIIEKLDERILKVEQQKKALLDEIIDRQLKNPSEEGNELEAKNLKAVNKVIDELRFLKDGDVIENQFVLKELLGTGSMSVVWKAFDKNRHEYVSLKFLRTQFIRDQSVLNQLRRSCEYMYLSKNTLTHLANPFTKIRKMIINDKPKLVYYARQYIPGILLEEYIEINPGHQLEVVEGLLKLGDDIDQLNKNGFILRKLTPSDIIVTNKGSKERPDLFLSIVDFDAILKKVNTTQSNYFLSASEYVAPEVLYNESNQSERSDVFSLGRIFCFVYFNESLPNLYQKNARELIEVLNCTPKIKLRSLYCVQRQY